MPDTFFAMRILPSLASSAASYKPPPLPTPPAAPRRKSRLRSSKRLLSIPDPPRARLHALVRLIESLRQLRLLRVRLIRSLGHHRLTAVWFIRNLRQGRLFGTLRVRCSSGIGHRRF